MFSQGNELLFLEIKTRRTKIAICDRLGPHTVASLLLSPRTSILRFAPIEHAGPYSSPVIGWYPRARAEVKAGDTKDYVLIFTNLSGCLKRGELPVKDTRNGCPVSWTRVGWEGGAPPPLGGSPTPPLRVFSNLPSNPALDRENEAWGSERVRISVGGFLPPALIGRSNRHPLGGQILEGVTLIVPKRGPGPGANYAMPRARPSHRRGPPRGTVPTDRRGCPLTTDT